MLLLIWKLYLAPLNLVWLSVFTRAQEKTHLKQIIREVSQEHWEGYFFFSLWSIGTFQGDLNPLSTRSILETCTLPVLLSGCENWILSNKCHEDLYSLGSWVRELNTPIQQHLWPLTSTVPNPTCFKGSTFSCEGNWPQTQFIPTELVYLPWTHCQMTLSVHSQGMQRSQIPLQHSIYHRDPNWCDCSDPTNIKKTIKNIDKHQRLEKCALKAPLITQVVTAGGSWPMLCDGTRHLGTKHLIRFMKPNQSHGQGSKPCPLCDAPTHPLIVY